VIAVAENKEPVGRLESRWTQVDDMRIHVRTSVDPVPPESPVVVLVHGVGVSSRNLMPTAVRLAPYYQVYAPDLLGFGRSSKPSRVLDIPELAYWLSAWIQAIKLERPAILTNSVGCQTVADMMVRHPVEVDRLVLIGPTSQPGARTVRQQLRRWLKGSSGESIHLTLSNLRDYVDCGPVRLVRTFQYSLKDHIEDKLPHIRVPTLVVRGSCDIIAPQDWAEEVTRRLPKARLEIVPGGMHTVNFQAAPQLVQIVRPFLEGK
jgi:2-hydroxy-6-oxonona-2,4-dienedioate hydrolase